MLKKIKWVSEEKKTKGQLVNKFKSILQFFLYICRKITPIVSPSFEWLASVGSKWASKTQNIPKILFFVMIGWWLVLSSVDVHPRRGQRISARQEGAQFNHIPTTGARPHHNKTNRPRSTTFPPQSALLVIFDQKDCVLPSAGRHQYCAVLQLLASDLHWAPLVVLLACAQLHVGAHSPGINGAWNKGNHDKVSRGNDDTTAHVTGDWTRGGTGEARTMKCRQSSLWKSWFAKVFVFILQTCTK